MSDRDAAKGRELRESSREKKRAHRDAYAKHLAASFIFFFSLRLSVYTTLCYRFAVDSEDTRTEKRGGKQKTGNRTRKDRCETRETSFGEIAESVCLPFGCSELVVRHQSQG